MLTKISLSTTIRQINMPVFLRFRKSSRLILLLLSVVLTILFLSLFLSSSPPAHTLLPLKSLRPALASQPPLGHKEFFTERKAGPNTPSLSSPSSSLSDDPSLPNPRFKPAHRITLVIVWSGIKVRRYLPLFLQSIAANAGRVDLVFIARKDQKSGRCVEIDQKILGRNVRFMCLSEEEYLELHVNYLARAWGGLTPAERSRLGVEITRRNDKDTVSPPGRSQIHSFFRLFRGEIFKQYFLDQNTTYWGWCDTDTILGDFETQFVWDIGSSYDVIVPSHQVYHKDIQVFMRGHLTIFANRPSTTALLHTYPAFRSFQAYLSSSVLGHGPEESSFSTYLFHQQPNLTFLTFDALLDGGFKASLISNRAIAIERTTEHFDRTSPDSLRLYLLPRLDPNPGMFSNGEGGYYPLVEKQTLLEIGVTKEWTWMPVEEAVSYQPTQVAGDVRPRRFLRRDVPGGPVIERVEDWARWEIPSLMQRDCFEGLYIHLLREKYTPWFQDIPSDPLRDGQVLVFSEWGQGAELWNGGDLVWDSRSRNG